MSDQATPEKTPFQTLQSAMMAVEAAKTEVARYESDLAMVKGTVPRAARVRTDDDIYNSLFSSIFGGGGALAFGGQPRLSNVSVTIGGTFRNAHVEFDEEDQETIRQMAERTVRGKLQRAKTRLEIAQQDLADAAIAFAAVGQKETPCAHLERRVAPGAA